MITNHAQVVVRRHTPAGQQCFFGYYDKCPWNSGSERVLAGMTQVSGRQPGPDDSLVLGYQGTGRDGSVFQPLGETLAWNFQQGAMAQWLDLDGRELVLFNVRNGKQAHATLVDTSGLRVRDLEQAVYALSAARCLAASIDFGRLTLLRPGYGYAGVGTKHSGDAAPEEDGLSLIDLATGTSWLAVSYAVLAGQVEPRGHGAPHWIDHIEFSPDGGSLVFLHRWIASDGGPLTRLMAMDTETGALSCLLDCGSAGHGVWLNNYEYGIWGRKGTLAASARSATSKTAGLLGLGVQIARKLIPLSLKSRFHKESFLIFNVRERTSSVGLPQIPHGRRGGHPSLDPSGKWIVSDTLPDSSGGRLLYLASLDGLVFIPLATFFHDPVSANGPYRCDLHPRWDRQGREVCIDSLHEGFRGVYSVEIPPILLSRGG